MSLNQLILKNRNRSQRLIYQIEEDHVLSSIEIVDVIIVEL